LKCRLNFSVDARDCGAYAERHLARGSWHMAMTRIETGTGHKRPAPAAGTKAAVAYLIASGATAISIVEHGDTCTFRVGSRIDPRAISIQWVLEPHARAIAKQARKIAGSNPDAIKAARALAQAAADQRATLTPHQAAIGRAGEAATKLDRYLESLHGTGILKEFNRAYRQRRMAAMASGKGFMAYRIAEARLRRALIPLLVGGGTIRPAQTLFAQIFK
jgi:hypothetical protein